MICQLDCYEVGIQDAGIGVGLGYYLLDLDRRLLFTLFFLPMTRRLLLLPCCTDTFIQERHVDGLR